MPSQLGGIHMGSSRPPLKDCLKKILENPQYLQNGNLIWQFKIFKSARSVKETAENLADGVTNDQISLPVR